MTTFKEILTEAVVGPTVKELVKKLKLDKFKPGAKEYDQLRKKFDFKSYSPTEVENAIKSKMSDKELVALHSLLRSMDAPNASTVVYRELYKRSMKK